MSVESQEREDEYPKIVLRESGINSVPRHMILFTMSEDGKEEVFGSIFIGYNQVGFINNISRELTAREGGLVQFLIENWAIMLRLINQSKSRKVII